MTTPDGGEGRDQTGRGSRFLAGARIYLEPRLIQILLLGFASGLPLALSFGTLSVRLTEDGISKAAIGLFAAVGTPYALKFIWAPLIDQLRLPGLARLFGHRRSWLLLTQAAVILTMLGLGLSDPAADPWTTALWAVLLAFASASQDIVIDAYRVERLPEDRQGAGAAMVVFGYRLGMLASGAGALYLAAYFDWFTAYAVMAGAMGLGVLAVLAGPEPRVDRSHAAEAEARAERVLERLGAGGPIGRAGAWLHAAVVAPFQEFLTRPHAWLILAFVAFYKFGDSLAGVMTNPFLVDIGFDKTQIAEISKLFGFWASMVGFWAGGTLLGALGTVRSLWICGILQALSNLAFMVQAEAGPDVAVLAAVIGFENLAGGMGTAVFVAYMSSLCNVSYTATQYALLSSFMAVARTWLSSSSGIMAEELGWSAFFLATTVAAIPGLILLRLVSRRTADRAI